LQNKDRKANKRVKVESKEEEGKGEGDGQGEGAGKGKEKGKEKGKDGRSSWRFRTYDCGGAVKVRFCISPPLLQIGYSHAAIHRCRTPRAAVSETKTGRKKVDEGIKSGATQTSNTQGVTAGVGRQVQVATPVDPRLGEARQIHGGQAAGTPGGEIAKQGSDIAADAVGLPDTVEVKPPPNPFLTANGTPKQEGVFEHRPLEPHMKVKVTPKTPPSAIKRTRQKGITRSRTGCLTCRSRRMKVGFQIQS
jgi:hypothetical protein